MTNIRTDRTAGTGTTGTLSDAELAAEILAAWNESRARRGQGPIG